MKKAIYQLAFSAVVLLCAVSCKKDDPAPPSIVGTWTETSYVSSGCTDPGDNDSDTCTSSCEVIVVTGTTITGDGFAYTYTKTGNTITAVSGSDTFVVTYTVTDTTLVITSQESADEGGCTDVSTYKRS